MTTKEMTYPSSILAFLLGSTLSAWLRFDRGRLVVSLVVMLISVAAALAISLLEARRAPPLVLPSAVNELGAREHLTPEEEQRFVAALQKDHHDRQLRAWRGIQRKGPASLIGRRAAFYYFWSCVFVLAVPPRAVPAHMLPWVPRFALVLTTLAVTAIAVAAPLGLRDWKRVLRSLETDGVGKE